MTTEPLYWHFLAADGRMARTGELVEVGKTYRFEGKPELCQRGLHASLRALDALKYAPGPIICRVALGGTVLHSKDKSVAQERTVLAMADATIALHEFACWCAEQALALVDELDPRSVKAIAMKRRWLRGEVTDGELAAAQVAAQAAAWVTGQDVPWTVVQTTVQTTVQATARAAARAAAWAAARAAASVAQDAARIAAQDAAWAIAWTAAQDTTWGAAWAAAQDAQNEQLEAMLRIELGNGKRG